MDAVRSTRGSGEPGDAGFDDGRTQNGCRIGDCVYQSPVILGQKAAVVSNRFLKSLESARQALCLAEEWLDVAGDLAPGADCDIIAGWESQVRMLREEIKGFSALSPSLLHASEKQ